MRRRIITYLLRKLTDGGFNTFFMTDEAVINFNIEKLDFTMSNDAVRTGTDIITMTNRTTIDVVADPHSYRIIM